MHIVWPRQLTVCVLFLTFTVPLYFINFFYIFITRSLLLSSLFPCFSLSVLPLVYLSLFPSLFSIQFFIFVCSFFPASFPFSFFHPVILASFFCLFFRLKYLFTYFVFPSFLPLSGWNLQTLRAVSMKMMNTLSGSHWAERGQTPWMVCQEDEIKRKKNTWSRQPKDGA